VTLEDIRETAHKRLDLLLDLYERYGLRAGNGAPAGKTEAAVQVHMIIEDILSGPAGWAFAHTRGLESQMIEGHTPDADQHIFEKIGQNPLSNEDKSNIENDDALASAFRRGVLDTIRRHPSIFQPESANWLGRCLDSLNVGDVRGPLIPADVGKCKNLSTKEEFGNLYTLLVYYLAGKSGKPQTNGAMSDGRTAAAERVSVPTRNVDKWQALTPVKSRQIAFEAGRFIGGHGQANSEVTDFLSQWQDHLESSHELWRAFYQSTQTSS